jgi:pimeloyl-ACP methyl ester carboxylesterase
VATFVLVHGSWHGGWCFDGIAERLRESEHEVIAPDLPGMGGDGEAMRAVTLDQWAEYIAGECRRATSRPVVLAGHSRGGLVISQAAEAAPEAIDALVYICAMMLPDGASRAEFKAERGPNPAFDDLISPVFDGAGTVVDPVRSAAVFAQLSPDKEVAETMSRLVAEPHPPRSARLHVTPERYGRIARTYVECTADRVIPIDDQRAMQALVPGARVETLDADHSPFLSRPNELVAALLRAVP